MNDRLISVVLASPAKIDGKREPAGKTVTVSVDVAHQLDTHSALEKGDLFDPQGLPLGSDFDHAVKEAVAAREAELLAIAADELAKAKEEHAAELAAMTERATIAETKAGELAGLLEAATERADAAEATVSALEAAAKSNNPPADPKQAGKKA